MTYFRTRALAVFALIILDACGGGGDNSDRLLGFDDPITIRGTAASGRPLTGATVTLKDRTGRTATTTTDADGSYSVDARGYRWPIVARVSGGTLGCGARAGCTPTANTRSYVGVSTLGVSGIGGVPGHTYTVNLTPMSHAVVSATTHREANGVFDAPDLLDPVNPLDLIEATFTVLDWLLRLDPTIFLPRDVDFVGGVFVPVPGDSQDATLDLMQSILTALFIDTPAFDLLVTSSPGSSAAPGVPIYCDVAGHYEGGYAGNTTGTWRADIDASTGLISNASNDGGGAGLGSIKRIGTGTQRASATLTTATSMRFEGGIDAGAAVTGTWSNPLGASGTFTGQRTSMASGCP